MYQDTVTIFNRRREATGDVWYPTVLEGVGLNVSRSAVVAKYGMESADKAILHVRYVWQDGRPVLTCRGDPGEKPYLLPLAWRGADDPAGAVTFQAGERFDIFFEGAWPDAGPVRDEDWPGGFYDSLVRAFDGVYAVSAVERYSVIPHFEITGR